MSDVDDDDDDNDNDDNHDDDDNDDDANVVSGANQKHGVIRCNKRSPVP